MNDSSLTKTHYNINTTKIMCKSGIKARCRKDDITDFAHTIFQSTGIQIRCVFLIPSPIPMFEQLLESSHRANSNKWSNIGFGE